MNKFLVIDIKYLSYIFVLERNFGFIWIGLRKYDNKWQWSVDFEDITFSSWLRYEPSGDGNCAHLWKAYGYYWNDVPCDGRRYSSICERNLVSYT